MAQVRRARNVSIIGFIKDRLRVNPDLLALSIKHEPQNTYILAYFNDTNEVDDFLIAYYPPGSTAVQLIQLHDCGKGQYFLDLLKNWTDSETRSSIEYTAEIGSQDDIFFQRNGFEPIRHVLSFSLVREDEVITHETEENNNGSAGQSIRIEGEASLEPHGGSGVSAGSTLAGGAGAALSEPSVHHGPAGLSGESEGSAEVQGGSGSPAERFIRPSEEPGLADV